MIFHSKKETVYHYYSRSDQPQKDSDILMRKNKGKSDLVVVYYLINLGGLVMN